VDETYVKAGGAWRSVYRAVDQHGQAIDVYVSRRRNAEAARRFFARALAGHRRPVEVVTDKSQALLAAVDDVLSEALPNSDRYCNNRVAADHRRLKARLRLGQRPPRPTAATPIVRPDAPPRRRCGGVIHEYRQAA
jgi:transposase-like protein